MMDSLCSSITSDDGQTIDKLRTIRPFTESQLLTLYNNDELEGNQQFINTFVDVRLFFMDLNLKEY